MRASSRRGPREVTSAVASGSLRSSKRSPDTASSEDIRRFQLLLAEAGVSIGNRNRIMTGLKFLFRVTLRRPISPGRSTTFESRRRSRW